MQNNVSVTTHFFVYAAKISSNSYLEICSLFSVAIIDFFLTPCMSSNNFSSILNPQSSEKSIAHPIMKA